MYAHECCEMGVVGRKPTQAAEKAICFVIPNEVRNLSSN